MKKRDILLSIGVLLLSSAILFSGCKKKEDPIVPAFLVTSITVQLQGGGEGLQFFAKCTNDDVQMTKVIITNPILTSITYNLNGNYFVQGELFDLQDPTEAYFKATGAWKIIFSGNRTADGTAFTIEVIVNISK